MRTALAFVLGAAVVSASWVLAGLSGHGGVALHPAPETPPPLEGLGEPVPDFGWRGPGEEPGRLSEFLGKGPVVVAIRDLTCPVSQRYGVTLEALERVFAAEGVRFLYVDLTPAGAPWDIGMAQEQAGLSGTYVRQMDDAFFTALHPRSTTEVFLIDAEGILRYRGAVDDQFGIDFARQAPDRRYLQQAIRTVLDGKAPTTTATFAPGCHLHEAPESRAAAAARPANLLTWSDDIRSVVEENCVSCHAEGRSGPFALDGYGAWVEHRDKIRSVVERGRMPPWPASPEYGRWANDRRLSQGEKGRLLRWIENGMPRGEGQAGVPDVPGPGHGDGGAWLHGAPDTVLAMAEPFVVREEGGSGVRTFYIPTDFGEDRWVSTVEVLPSAPEAVVQAVVLVESPDTPTEQRSLGLEGFFAGYAPGYQGGVFPPGTAKRLPAGAWLKLRIHYRPQATPVTDRTRIGLTFSDEVPRAVLETRSAYSTRFEIPSHAPHHAVTAEHLFLQGGEIHALMPHMHLRGSAIRYVLEDPRGNERILLDIPRYYFQFRLNYVPAEPIPVEAGSILRVTGWYDNSEVNLSNPDPSVTAAVGAEITDELLIGYFDFVASGPPVGALTDFPDPDR